MTDPRPDSGLHLGGELNAPDQREKRRQSTVPQRFRAVVARLSTQGGNVMNGGGMKHSGSSSSPHDGITAGECE